MKKVLKYEEIKKQINEEVNEAKYKHMYSPIISDEEDDRWNTWEYDFEKEVVDFIEGVKKDCYEIGGDFRGPGYWATAKKMIEVTLRKAGR